MQLDSHILLAVSLNVSLIVVFSWLGFQFLSKNSYAVRKVCDAGRPLVSIRALASIRPVIRKYLVVRRKIKISDNDDETPFFTSSVFSYN
ncbi:hypothetical protein [Phosphitispora fastidiosa]|uniref:hypothetical protein n=1 Tax=Phosphitispora fastidiosa TaxID=2837202 RepID=UPI001E36EA0A|nr:hypothetical protein [Phosphitispora fastidiosa]MBU7008697.1 hypothetical protein [Phosphitispora fastidiosa]